ncbi:MAG: M28 family peptidase [Flavobacteriales bacterium]|nr:M28 family peptidase [Flavobacteriales bacterium]
MKKRILIVLAVVFVLLSSLVMAVTNPVIVKSNLVKKIEVDADRIKNDVVTLCSTTKPRNAQNLESLNEAASYIADEWLKLGLEVDTQKYVVDGKEFKNLICSFGPKDTDRIIVGAHYDVCEEQAGADDNASGTAGILELARLLQKHQPELTYRIDLVAYTLEEPPYFRTKFMGSAVHAKYLFDNKIPVKAMLCLEMIGYFSEEKGSQDYPVGILKLFYPNKGNYISVVSKMGGGNGRLTREVKKGIKRGSDIDVTSVNAPASMPGIDFSDHLNYWKYDYPAVMVTNTAFYRNKNYHQPTDLPETLDYIKMAEVIKGVYNAIIHFK